MYIALLEDINKFNMVIQNIDSKVSKSVIKDLGPVVDSTVSLKRLIVDFEYITLIICMKIHMKKAYQGFPFLSTKINTDISVYAMSWTLTN